MAAAINVPLSFCEKKRLLCRLPINLNISFVFREFCLSSMQYKETLIFLWQEQARRTSAWTRPSFSSYNDRAPGGNVHYVIMHYSPYELCKTFYVHEIRCCECLLFVPSHKCFHILEMSSSHTGEHANNNILNPGAERSARKIGKDCVTFHRTTAYHCCHSTLSFTGSYEKFSFRYEWFLISASLKVRPRTDDKDVSQDSCCFFGL